MPMAIWNQPPSWLYLPSLGIGTGADLMPIALLTTSSESSSGSQQPVADAARIRGRGDTPGPSHQDLAGERSRLADSPSSSRWTAAREEVDTASTLATSASAEGHMEEKLSAAMKKITNRNASIAISLADHAERVARKRARGNVTATQSAAERMEALRRRITERRCAGAKADVAKEATAGGAQGMAASIGDGSHGCAAACSNGNVIDPNDKPPSNEDDKIHLNLNVYVGTADTSRGEEVEAGGNGLADSATSGGGGRNAAATCAASAWAQHAVPLGRDGDGDRHLSLG